MNRSVGVLICLFGCVLLGAAVLFQVRLTQKLTASGGSSSKSGEGQQQLLSELAQAQAQMHLLATSISNCLRQMDSLEARQRELTTTLEAPRPPRTPILFQPRLLSPDSRRSWGPEQATGAPDTMEAGDRASAWASREPNAGPEWLKLDYAKEVEIAEVRVRETYNPGAVVRLTAVFPDGRESLLWEGAEPPAQAPVDRPFTPSFGAVRGRSLKIYLDTRKVLGWNEIDAVELIGKDGTRQWATNAAASSTFAEASVSSLR
jgi:hypothetical protein